MIATQGRHRHVSSAFLTPGNGTSLQSGWAKAWEIFSTIVSEQMSIAVIPPSGDGGYVLKRFIPPSGDSGYVLKRFIPPSGDGGYDLKRVIPPSGDGGYDLRL